MPDAMHDPGTGVAGARATRASTARTRFQVAGADVRVGTASWTDPTILPAGVFYPPDVRSAERRLRFYSSRFPLVEVDSTYYAIPARRMAALWAERTPDDFVFDVKAHALMTGHPTEPSRLPRELRDALPRGVAGARRVYGKDLPPTLLEDAWTMFLDALEPLRTVGKLGAILLQYPPWFTPTHGHASAMAAAAARLAAAGVRGAVELRHPGWMAERVRERTLAWLRDHNLTYVCVDTPQGLRNSMPPVAEVTVPALAVVRLHGRRTDTWERGARITSERYRYLYDADELLEWEPKIREVARAAEQVHVILNNCHGNYGTTNALELARMLGGADQAGAAPRGTAPAAPPAADPTAPQEAATPSRG